MEILCFVGKCIDFCMVMFSRLRLWGGLLIFVWVVIELVCVLIRGVILVIWVVMCRFGKLMLCSVIGVLIVLCSNVVLGVWKMIFCFLEDVNEMMVCVVLMIWLVFVCCVVIIELVGVWIMVFFIVWVV